MEQRYQNMLSGKDKGYTGKQQKQFGKKLYKAHLFMDSYELFLSESAIEDVNDIIL